MTISCLKFGGRHSLADIPHSPAVSIDNTPTSSATGLAICEIVLIGHCNNYRSTATEIWLRVMLTSMPTNNDKETTQLTTERAMVTIIIKIIKLDI
jgi:hypothetical protein